MINDKIPDFDYKRLCRKCNQGSNTTLNLFVGVRPCRKQLPNSRCFRIN